MSDIQLLKQISDNTSPRQTFMISISSKRPEFVVNFPSPISVYEIALAKLRVYNSWPNIRSDPFGNQQSNNSIVFAYKNRLDGTPDWNVVGIPTGSYEIEDINDELARRIASIVGDEIKSDQKPPINIQVDQPRLSSIIEIIQGYSVDIYNSSIRTVLGWPEIQPKIGDYSTPEPVKSDYITDAIGPENPSRIYNYFEELDLTKVYKKNYLMGRKNILQDITVILILKKKVLLLRK